MLDADGSVLLSPASGALPVSKADTAVITSGRADAVADHEFMLDGEPFLVHTVKFGSGAAMLARSLQESQDALGSILRSTFWSVLAVVFAAVVSGWLIARQVTRRLERLTDVAGQVASTGRLDIEVPIDGNQIFGARDESLVFTDRIENVPEEYRQIGTSILMENDKGQTRSFLVTRLDEETLTVDGNNPLCGREVVFRLEILTVRDATEEEVHAGGAIAEKAAIDPSRMRPV